MNNTDEKSRDLIKAEREARKAAKAAAKNKSKNIKQNDELIKSCNSNEKNNNKIDNIVEVTKEDDKVTKIVDNLSKIKLVDNQDTKNEQIDKNDGKSKSELRAERRAKQEAQRAAKQAEQDKKKLAKKTDTTVVVTPLKKTDDLKNNIIDNNKKITQKLINNNKNNEHEINLFKHLYQEREQAYFGKPKVNSHIHPAIVRLGVQYENKIIVGSNARCIAFLSAIKELIKDFERPSQADFTRGLETSFQESSSYLHNCRPLAVSMQNALKHLKWKMAQFPSTISDNDAKNNLITTIDTYIQEQIFLADQAISNRIQTKITNGDVILTYGFSSLIQKILTDAHKEKIKFRVVVVDGRPWLEGKELLRRLSKIGIECSYVLINALSFIMPEVNKVFLGAHAILANGAVMSRAGTAQVALMAKAFNVPVLVACETHKSCERVQTDSIVYNEIGNADELTDISNNNKKNILNNWRAKKYLNLLNITYDVTPADLVTAVVTELAILPCTSVPVILRIKPSEI